MELSTRRVIGPLVAVASAGLVFALLPASTTLGSHGVGDREVAAAEWPVMASAGNTDPVLPLAVATNRPRGAVRLTNVPSGEPITLHVLPMANGSRKDVARFATGHRVGATVEFYGIEAGPRQLFFRRGAESTALLSLDVPETSIQELVLPPFAPTVTRSVAMASGATAIGSATVLLRYQGFDLLRHWTGRAIELRSPLANPVSIAVSVASADGTDRKRFGESILVDPSTKDIEIALSPTDNALVLSSGEAQFLSTTQDYGIAITPAQSGSAANPTQPFTQILSALRADEFDDVPREHTWLDGPPDRELAIDGIGEDGHWVGVGLAARARYVLWRKHEDKVDQVWRRPIAKESSEIPNQGLVVPGWIRTVSLSERLAAGTRKHHKAGPSQVWKTTPSSTGLRRRLVAWVDGDGMRRELPASPVSLQWPDGLLATDRVSLTVRTPHPTRGDGLRVESEYRWGERLAQARLPDGLLDIVVARRGQMHQQLRGVVQNGELLGSPVWRDSAEAAAANVANPSVVTVLDHENQPVAAADVFDEASQELASTNTVGSAEAALAAFRTPSLVSIRTDKPGFTHNSYVLGAKAQVELPFRTGATLSWTSMQAMLGVDLQTLGVDNLFVARQPGGQTAQINPQRRAILQKGEFVEFTGTADSSEVWGWLDERSLSVGLGPTIPGSIGFADVVIVNRSLERVVHVTLPRTEIRLGVGTGRMRRIRVVAPVHLGLLSAGAADDSKMTFAVGEGVRADLLPNDVLVVTYDDVR